MSEQQEELDQIVEDARAGRYDAREIPARDRAIEGLARRIESQALISDRPGQLDELEQIAREVRALAGAPTADVAALRKRIADTLHMGLDDASPNDPMADDDDHESWVARVQEWADWIHEQYAPLLAAAPEGVDAATCQECGMDDLSRRGLCSACVAEGCVRSAAPEGMPRS